MALISLDDAALRVERWTAGLLAGMPSLRRGWAAALAWVSLAWGGSLLVGVAALQAAVGLTMLLGGRVSWWHFPIFPIVVAIAALTACRSRWGSFTAPKSLLIVAPLALFLAGSFWIAGKTIDLSADGQTAHQDAAIHLANGWNPIHDPYFDRRSELADYVLADEAQYMRGSYILELGSKGTYYDNAATLKLFGRINIGKGFNFVLLAASFLLVFAAAHHTGVAPGWSFLAASASALNPVALNQILSTYVDGPLGLALTALVASAFLVATTRSRLATWAFAAALIVGINAKITGFFYAGFLALAATVLIRLYTKDWRAVAPLVLGSAVGVFIVGFSPIVYNFVTTGELLKHLDADAVYIWQNSFVERHDRLTKLVISLFSETHINPDTPVLKAPFGISAFEWSTFKHIAAFDPRIGGFGPWMGGALVVSLVTLLAAAGERAPGRGLVTLAALALIASALANEEAWWARFVPQLWLLPVVIAAYGVRLPARSATGALARVLMVVVVLNAAYCGVKSLWFQYNAQIVANRVLDIADALSPPPSIFFDNFRSNRQLLLDRSIDYVEQSTPCEGAFYRASPSLMMDLCLTGRDDPQTAAAIREIEDLERILMRRGLGPDQIVR